MSGLIIEKIPRRLIISNYNFEDMKKQYALSNLKALVTLAIVTLLNQLVYGQDNTGSGSSSSGGSSTTTTTHTTTSNTSTDWYTSPWVWVIAAAVLILLIVALSSGRRDSGRSDKVTVTKTVRRDSDV